MEDEKIEALAKNLGVKIDEIEETTYGSNSFIVDSRRVRRGMSPNEYKIVIAKFKELLKPRELKMLDEFLNLGNKASKETRDKVYQAIDKKLQEVDNPEEIEKHFLYITNVLYWLLEDPKEDNNAKTIKALRSAWKGRKVKDERELEDENSGEYLVLTDGEADELAEDRIDSYIDECVLPDMEGALACYFDRERFISDNMDRANELATYDGKEDYEEINGTTYYIYQTN